MEDITFNSDVVISAVGKPKILTIPYFNSPDIIVDVGINRDKNGKLCGDVDRENVEVYCVDTYITPVPNGVGKLTVNSLLENVVTAYEYMN